MVIFDDYNTSDEAGENYYSGCCWVYFLFDGSSYTCSNSSVNDFILEMPTTCNCINWNECHPSDDTNICFESPATSRDTYLEFSVNKGLPGYDSPIINMTKSDKNSCVYGPKWENANAYFGQVICLRNYPLTCDMVPGGYTLVSDDNFYGRSKSDQTKIPDCDICGGQQATTTSYPTRNPTNRPTKKPTTKAPSKTPTTASPTKRPTNRPTTVTPTKKPTTPRPTAQPTEMPTVIPSQFPTDGPTTSYPTTNPTVNPTS